MRFAYADPPYLGCCKLYNHEHGTSGRWCWDDLETHQALIDQLCAGWDAWALSCHVPSLHLLRPLCPDGTRTAAWVKPFAVFKPGVNPAYTWEPVLYYGGRHRDRSEPTVKDHLIEEPPAVVESITLQKGLTGAKPRRFAFFIFDLLGAEPTDQFDDLFPGTGIVGECWDEYCGRVQAVQGGLAL